VVISGFVSFNFCPTNAKINSLLLSTLAALAIHGFSTASFSTELKDHRESWLSILGGALAMNLRVYLLLAPLLLPLCLPHPTSVICNLLLGPVLGTILFPASMASFVIPPLTTLVDHVWKVTLLLVQYFERIIPTSLTAIDLSLSLRAAYVALVVLLCLYWERKMKKSRK
jgi:hypothetical protein